MNGKQVEIERKQKYEDNALYDYIETTLKTPIGFDVPNSNGKRVDVCKP